VKNHVAHIYDKTGVAIRSAAALYAVTNGLVEP
jgi:DNA-binding NarL/FixJ family response regulator